MGVDSGDAGDVRALPRIALAVLRPTPGSVTSSRHGRGTSPSEALDEFGAESDQGVGLVAVKPVGRMSSSSSVRSAAHSPEQCGTSRTTPGRREGFTRCQCSAGQDGGHGRSSGLVKSSSAVRCGKAIARVRFIRQARRTSPSRVSLSHLVVLAATAYGGSLAAPQPSVVLAAPRPGKAPSPLPGY